MKYQTLFVGNGVESIFLFLDVEKSLNLPLKKVKLNQFSSCIFRLNLRVVDCQPLRQAASCWNGEGSFLYTSSSAPYDCNDNGLCDEVGLKKFLNCSLSQSQISLSLSKY